MQRIPKLRASRTRSGRVHPGQLDAIVALGVDEVTLETWSTRPRRRKPVKVSAAET